MKLIPLTRGLFTKVDDEDFEKFAIYRWYADKSQNGFRPRRTKRIAGRVTGIFLYREIMAAKPGQHVDHINGDTLDNQRGNLRICTPGENIRNQKLHKNNTSGYKGLAKNEKRKHKRPWRATITINRKPVFLGNFATKEEAARAYDAKAKELHGEYASLNFG